MNRAMTAGRENRNSIIDVNEAGKPYGSEGTTAGQA